MTKYEVGSIHNTPKGKIKILEYIAGKKLPNGKKQHPRAIIKFLNTGCVRNVQTTNIAKGKIEDFRAKTVYNIGYIGSEIKIPARGTIIRRIYDLWANMLKRCYGNYRGKYTGCNVDPRWHSFTNFLNTINNVEGYEMWEKHPNEKICLDKDIKVKGNKTYSVDTCMFVTNNENVRDSLYRRWCRRSDSA